jgi:hypothetical protein
VNYSPRDVAEARSVRQILPTPQTEDVGGYAYECIYLAVRFPPKAHLAGEDLEAHVEGTFKPKLGRLELALDPPLAARFALVDARRALEDFDRFGLPEAGGFNDQDASWLVLIRCALTARERAEAERAREETLEPEG